MRALVAVAFQCLIGALLLLAGGMLIEGLAEAAYRQHGANPLAVLVLMPHELHPDASGPMVAVLAGFLLLVAVFAGLWIRSALRHLPMYPVWFSLATITGLLAAGEGLLVYLWFSIDPNSRPPADPYASRFLGGTLTAAVMYGVLIAAGFPFGRVALAAWRANWKVRRAKYRRRRRRLREDR